MRFASPTLVALVFLAFAGCDQASLDPDLAYPAPVGLGSLDGSVYYEYEAIHLNPTNQPEDTELVVQEMRTWGVSSLDFYADGFTPDKDRSCGPFGTPVDSLLVNRSGEGVDLGTGYDHEQPGYYHALRFAYEGADGIGTWTRPVIVRAIQSQVIFVQDVLVPFALDLPFPSPTDRPVESGPLRVAERLEAAGIDPTKVRRLVPYGDLVGEEGAWPAGDYYCLGFADGFPAADLPPEVPGEPISQCRESLAQNSSWGAFILYDRAFYPFLGHTERVVQRDETSRFLAPGARLAIRYRAPREGETRTVNLRMKLATYVEDPAVLPPPVPVVGDWETHSRSCSTRP